MKTPSTNVSRSLRDQRTATPRGAEMVEVTGMKMGGPSMVAPGEGGVEMPPGPMKDRSAAVYTAPMERFGGRKP
jgi:hypothetical protein